VVGSSLTAGGNERAFLWTSAHGMEDLGTLGGANSVAFGIAQTGQVVGISQTAAGLEEAFLWTRGRGMRGLGTLGGPSSIAFSVNTHRRVVGSSLTPGEPLPFLWTAGGGMRALPTLGGNFGTAIDLNEFGKIVGTTTTAQGKPRATLWTPTAGPLAVAPTDEGGAPEVAAPPGVPRDASTALCALGRKWGEWSRYGIVASRACLAR
jgi:probable HAF family extracellular repeat protein